MNLDISVFITDIQSRLPYVSSSMIYELIRNYLINDSIALLIASGGFTFWPVLKSVSSLMNSFNKHMAMKRPEVFSGYGVQRSLLHCL